MIDTKKFLIGVGLLLLVGIGVHTFTSIAGAGGEGGVPSTGTLAELDSTWSEGWEEVARVSPERIGSGAIRGLDVRGDTILLLQRDRWTVLVNGAVVRSAGSATAGSPQWIGSGTAIAALEEGIAILDRTRGEISVWSLEGERMRGIPIQVGDEVATEPLDLVSDGRATLFASVRHLRPDGVGAWNVVRFREGHPPDTVYRAPTNMERWGVHNFPVISVRPGGVLAVAPSNEWRVIAFDLDGEPISEWVREDGPRWRVPDAVRREYAGLLALTPAAMRRGFELPDEFPPVRGIMALPGGGWLVLVAASYDDELHAELLDEELNPVSRLWESPQATPVFLADGAIYRIRDLMESTVVERLRVRLGD